MRLFIFIIVLFSFSFGWSVQTSAQDHIVLIETSYGNIKIKLYNETPLHRDNFLKLVEKHFYDSLLFHRVINTFMIQGGDPDSKSAKPEKMLGEGDVGYTIPAEFHPTGDYPQGGNPTIFHKRGVLAAARNGDEENPERASSGCQFYIVQGKVFTDSLLDVAGKRIDRMQAYNKVVRNSNNKILLDNFAMYQKNENIDSIKSTKARIDKLTDDELLNIAPHKFTAEQRKIYTTIGGTPHLDNSYTVFGEVLEGMDVVDKIALAPTGKANRPLSDIRILKISILK
jgi:cyclophilin family peptidyl-prolyl cis-trans isomerase